MFRNFLIIFSLMVSMLLVSCASQKSMTPSNANDINPVLNAGESVQKPDKLIAEKPAAVPIDQTAEVEKEAKPAKETGTAIEKTTLSKAEPLPEEVSIDLNVQFDTGKADIKPVYQNDMKRIADFMNKYPSASAIIVGHTDIIGKEAVNIKLSYQRAANIKLYLAERHGIDSARMKAIGYDCQKPIAGNKTAEGRQKNRRVETHIENIVSRNSLYSFFEDSSLPKGGFSIVNQKSIDAMIESFKEQHGTASYLSKMVKSPTLELYKMWGGVFSHCALRIETDRDSFYQIELQSLPDLKKAGIKEYHRSGAALILLGRTSDQMDIVEFTDKSEREKLDNKEPPYATMPICIDTKATRKTTQWYKDCLSSYAEGYNPENALETGKRTKVFDYNPATRNCCNFAEEALKACGLVHCFDLGKSTGLQHKTGPLEE